MTDEKLARRYAQDTLGLPVETTPRLYGYLHYHMHLGGADHEEVIREHERFERRPLTRFLNQTFDDAMRCRLMANMVSIAAAHSMSEKDAKRSDQ